MIPCSRHPATAKPLPTITASTARGSLTYQTLYTSRLDGSRLINSERLCQPNPLTPDVRAIMPTTSIRVINPIHRKGTDIVRPFLLDCSRFTVNYPLILFSACHGLYSLIQNKLGSEWPASFGPKITANLKCLFLFNRF